MPFTRKPLMLIVDSPNSIAFKHIPKLFGQPVVCLMSPIDTTEAFSGRIYPYHNSFIDFRGVGKGGQSAFFIKVPLALAFCNYQMIHTKS